MELAKSNSCYSFYAAGHALFRFYNYKPGIIGAGIYSSLDKRVLVLETSTERQDMRDLTQDADRVRISNEMKDATIDIKHSIERLSEKVDRINDTRK